MEQDLSDVVPSGMTLKVEASGHVRVLEGVSRKESL